MRSGCPPWHKNNKPPQKILSANSCVTSNDIQHYAAEHATTDYYFAGTYRKNHKKKTQDIYLKNRTN